MTPEDAAEEEAWQADEEARIDAALIERLAFREKK